MACALSTIEGTVGELEGDGDPLRGAGEALPFPLGGVDGLGEGLALGLAAAEAVALAEAPGEGDPLAVRADAGCGLATGMLNCSVQAKPSLLGGHSKPLAASARA